MSMMDWFRRAPSSAGVSNRRETAHALDRIVQLTNPRLRFARRYAARLTPAVETAIAYARSLVASVPAARDASAGAWQSDAYMRAFFATADDLTRTFSRSPDLRAWFDANPGAQEICAVLSMRLVERRILGVALEGGVIRRDVPQTTVCFDDYRVRIRERSEGALRAEIESRVVDQLALTGLAISTRDQGQRDVLEHENALLRTRLRLLHGRGAGLVALAGQTAPDGSVLARLQAELAMNEANLRSIASGGEALEYQLERLREVLASPREHFFIAAKRVRINRMNIVLPDDDPAPGETLDLQTARVPIPDGPPEFRTFVLVRFPRSALLAKGTLLDEAARMLQ
jgi:hypothetical protein